MTTKNVMFILFAYALGFVSQEALALSLDSPAPYKKVVGDKGQFVFVMLVGNCERYRSETRTMNDAELAAFRARRRGEETQGHTLSIACASYEPDYSFSTTGTAGQWKVFIDQYRWITEPHRWSESGPLYERSGLYPNDGSATPLWTVEGYAFDFNIYLSGAGRYLVEIDSSWIAFYDRGKLLKEYTVKDLIRRPARLPHMLVMGSPHIWLREGPLFDDKAHTLTLTTLGEERYIFDFASGEILRSEQGPMSEVTAEVVLKSGEKARLSAFNACGGLEELKGKLEEGWVARLRIYGSRAESDLTRQATKQNKVELPFHAIRTINAEPDETNWHLLLRNGESLMIAVEPIDYCGEAADGQAAEISSDQIKSIVFP